MLPTLLGPLLATVVALSPGLAPAPPQAGPSGIGAGQGGSPAGTTASGLGSSSSASLWRAPVDAPVTVLRPFHPPDHPWLPGHRGVDLAASPGDPVRAAGAGTVAFAGDLAGRGVVVVDHDGGLRTTYEPVAADVTLGQAVRAGDALGSLASGTVHCDGPPTCLHWGLRRGRDYLDPWLLLHHGRPVLLPP